LRDGRAYPKVIADAPALLPEEVFYYNAYQDLGTCRLYEGGYIPWTAVKEFALFYDLEEERFETLLRVCNLVDDGLKSGKGSKSSQPGGQQPPQPGRSNRRRGRG